MFNFKKKMKFNLTKLKPFNNKIILVIDYIKKNIIMNEIFIYSNYFRNCFNQIEVNNVFFKVKIIY